MARSEPKAGSAAALFKDAINCLEGHLRTFEGAVLKPIVVNLHGSIFRRYQEQTASQAIVLKFAGYVSGLSAIDALLSRNLIYETVPLQRGLDETLDDIALVSGSLETGKAADLRERFLAGFWYDPVYYREHPTRETAEAAST